MLDWSKLFNIIFVAAVGGLAVFLLISTIVVAAKGKRKCNAFDVVLRIASTLTLIASAAMFACVILIMLDGGFCIRLVTQPEAEEAAFLVMNGDLTELPLPELFVALASVIGSGVVAVLLMLSLAALIVDCLVANKKTPKPQKSKPQTKTPEQLKREAELERIKRIGESAVRKTADAAASTSAAEEKSTADTPDTADNAAATESEPSFDWRDPVREQKPTEFVGIKTADDDFDSFDAIPDEPTDSFDGFDSFDAPEEQAQDEAVQPERDITALEDGEEPAPLTESDDTPDYTDYEAEIAEQDYEETAEQGEVEYTEQNDEDIEEQDEAEYIEQEDEETAEQDEAEADYDDLSAWQYDAENGGGDEESEINDEDAEDTVESAENAELGVNDEDAAEPEYTDKDIEPNRNIYIPRIRTIVRGDNLGVDAMEQPVTEKKPVREGRDRAVPERKPTPEKKKPAQKPKRGGGGGRTQKPAADVPADKKLPVTRRYVILDRHNAVNMFGEYLKERKQSEKEKLKSSINTIIIE